MKHDNANDPAPSFNYRRPAIAGTTLIVLLIGGIIGWAYSTRIAGAVIASGAIMVEGKPKSIQHLDGGIVKEIHVMAGDRVERGQTLMELDGSTVAATLAIYKGRLAEAIVRKARLLAELEDKDEFDPPADPDDVLTERDFADVIVQQTALIKARRTTRLGQLDQLDEKIRQFENQIEGTEGLIYEKTNQVDAFEEDRVGVDSLVKQQWAAKSRLTALERAQADLRGQIAEHRAEIARIRNSISEVRISKLQIEREFREKVIEEIEKTDSSIHELRQQTSTTVQQLRRISIKAPVAGIVHELSVFTIGGVVQPGQTVMQVIPVSDRSEIELRVDTRSVDEVFVGQRVFVRFPAFHQRTTPQLEGEITGLSPSSVVDENTGYSFYRATVAIADEEMSALDGKKLIPGMPVEALIPTTERTVLSYLVKPLVDQVEHAFREE